MSFGYEIQEDGEDHFIKIQETLVDQINEFSVPGAFLVDIFPWRGFLYVLVHENVAKDLQCGMCPNGSRVPASRRKRRSGGRLFMKSPRSHITM